MGLDVNLYAQGDVTDEQIDAADEFLRSRGVEGWNWRAPDDTIERERALVRSDEYPDRIEWATASRFYGAGYERGHWPDIHNAIACLRVALPGCTVHYGGDSDEDAPEVTDESLAETWAHWLSPDGQAYRRHIAQASQRFTRA